MALLARVGEIMIADVAALDVFALARYPMKYLNAFCLLGAALVASPAVSYAQQYGFAARDINLRAGPSRDYPVVAVVPAGVSILVEGCLNDYQWCDVTSGPDRGWVYAGNITYTYHGSRVPLISYGAMLGIGILAFSLGDYWDNHYQARPWYPQRQQWINRSIPGSRSRNDGIRPELTTPQFRPGVTQLPPLRQAPARPRGYGLNHPPGAQQDRPQQAVPPVIVPRAPQQQPQAGQQPPRHRPAADNPRQAQSRPAYAAPPRAPQQAHPPGNAQRQPWQDAGGGKN
jgi:uncharacterized protein YraI